MNLKTFQADSMARAMALVKRELGPEAVILHTRSYRRGGVLGWGAKPVVEITASNDVSIIPPRLRREVLANQREGQSAAVARPRQVAGRAPAMAGGGASALLGRTYAPPADDGAEFAVHDERPVTAPPASPAGESSGLGDEIRQIHGMVHRMMRSQSATARDLPDKLFHQYLALLEQEVTEELADEVVRNVRGRLDEAQLEDEAAVREAIGREIAALIPADADPPAAERAADGRPRTIALIGPTGVGKTTTLAKLAATFKLRDKKRVALVTIDTYRIAAVDQLQTYANIINLPLRVVLTPQELREAMASLRGYDAVLIDTAGRSQRDDDKLDQLREFMRAADPHEVHLVLSSTCNQPVLMEAVERFSQIDIDRIIFTKLDEAVSFGVLLNVVRRVNKRLSYVTTGQDVPHQIERGRPDRLADLVLGGRL